MYLPALYYSYVFTNTVQAKVTEVIGNNNADDNTCIIRNQNSKLECSFTGVPTPTTLWHKGPKKTRVPIPGSNEKYVVTSQANKLVLTIRDVTDGDDDMYTCVATNTMNGMPVMDEQTIETKICSKHVK